MVPGIHSHLLYLLNDRTNSLPMLMYKAITNYIDNKEYDSKNDLGGVPNRVFNPEGYADALTTTGPLYKYYRRDHLGNVREVWQAAYSVYIPSRNITQNYAATTLQRTQYYPSGLPWAANTGDNPGLQNKKYNAKEFIEMHGFDTYDYGARGYYAAIGRFMTVDPAAELYYSWSTNQYVRNNPVLRIDPDGMWDDDFYFNQKKELDYVAKTDQADRFFQAEKNGDNKEISIMQLTKGMLGSYTNAKTGLADGDYSFDRGVFDADNASGGRDGVPNWVGTAIGTADATAGYFETAYIVQAGQTFRYGQRINGVVRSANTLTRANRISSLSTAKTFSRAGTGLAILSAGATVVDGLTNDKGWQNHHSADLFVTGVIYGTAASFPVVGWVAGGLYFVADLTTQYYTHKSITQNLFDE